MDKQRRGRPSKGDDAKRVPLNMRTTRELRDKLDAVALASGRSLAQEVEHRLERSFTEDDVLGGTATAEVLRALAAIIRAIERRTGVEWQESDYAAGLVLHAATGLFRAMRPELSDHDQRNIEALNAAVKHAATTGGEVDFPLFGPDGTPLPKEAIAQLMRRLFEQFEAVDAAAGAAARQLKVRDHK